MVNLLIFMSVSLESRAIRTYCKTIIHSKHLMLFGAWSDFHKVFSLIKFLHFTLSRASFPIPFKSHPT